VYNEGNREIIMDNKLIEKIQKLLALSDSPNKNEAEAAMTKAQELMLKHNIDMRSVEQHDSEYINETSESFKREHPSMKFINSIVEKYFFVRIVKSNRRTHKYFNYIGEKQNVQTAIHTVNFLKSTFDRLWKEYKAETGAGRGSKQSFVCGLYEGFCEKMDQQRQEAEQKYELVLVEDPRATEKMNELFPRLKTSSGARMNLRDANAQSAGHAAGRNINLSAGYVR
jgi:hypothetical protein